MFSGRHCAVPPPGRTEGADSPTELVLRPSRLAPPYSAVAGLGVCAGLSQDAGCRSPLRGCKRAPATP
jgi:hypothetical protein